MMRLHLPEEKRPAMNVNEAGSNLLVGPWLIFLLFSSIFCAGYGTSLASAGGIHICIAVWLLLRICILRKPDFANTARGDGV